MILSQKGNIVIWYEQFAFTHKYKVYNKVNKYNTIVSFNTQSEAQNYFDKF